MQEENRMQQRRLNARHKELMTQFQRKEMPCYEDLLELSHKQINFDHDRRERKASTTLSKRKTIKKKKQSKNFNIDEEGSEKSQDKNFKKLFKRKRKIPKDQGFTPSHQ